MRQPPNDPRQVPDPVAIPVLIAARVDLVDDRASPPSGSKGFRVTPGRRSASIGCRFMAEPRFVLTRPGMAEAMRSVRSGAIDAQGLAGL